MRTSSLRGLGATLNVFAIESFIDELAERAGQDPVAYRLSVLSDARARAVVEHVARIGGWQAGLPSGTGRGRGIGFARYKNMAAYAAVVADVEVDESVRLMRVWCAADAGLVINPDGAINQLEGGIIQAASWALKEGVRLDTRRHQLARLGELPGAALQRGAGGDRRAGRPHARICRRSGSARRRAGRPSRRSATPWHTRWARACATCR